jgi:hypothetical protein
MKGVPSELLGQSRVPDLSFGAHARRRNAGRRVGRRFRSPPARLAWSDLILLVSPASSCGRLRGATTEVAGCRPSVPASPRLPWPFLGSRVRANVWFQRYRPNRAAPRQAASFISSLIRCTVPTPRPSSFATLMMPFSERSALRAAVFEASPILGRPRVVPFALARFRPAIARSRTIALSNSANTRRLRAGDARAGHVLPFMYRGSTLDS